MAAGYPPPNPNQPGWGQPPGYPPPQGPPYYGGGPIQPYGAGMMVDPNAPYGYDPRTGLPFSDKQKIVAGLLQLFVGVFGVGRFYTGHTGLAIAQILVTWGTCGAGAVWPVIDGIMMLAGQVTDAEGRPLRD